MTKAIGFLSVLIISTAYLQPHEQNRPEAHDALVRRLQAGTPAQPPASAVDSEAAALLKQYAGDLRLGQTVASLRTSIPRLKLDCGAYAYEGPHSTDFSKVLIEFEGSGCATPKDDAPVIEIVLVAPPQSKAVDRLRDTLTQRLGPPSAGCRMYSTGDEQTLWWQGLSVSMELSGDVRASLDSLAVYRGQPRSRDAGEFSPKPCPRTAPR